MTETLSSPPSAIPTPSVSVTVAAAANQSSSPHEEESSSDTTAVKWRAGESQTSLSSQTTTGRKSPYRKKNGLVSSPSPRSAPPPHPFFPVDQNFDNSREHGGHHHSHHHLRIHRKSAHKLPSISRSRLYHSLSALDKKGKLWSKFYAADEENVKRVLEAVASDHLVLTDPADNKNRRTIVVERGPNEKFGFTIQSYIFKNSVQDTLEKLSYVDNVELSGPAHFSGLRRGDVILSINGESVRDEDHESVVRIIGQSLSMRMVVLFEDCAQKIDLFSRSIKLKKLLSDKEFELRIMDLQENRLMQGLPLLSQDETLSFLRSSTASSPALSLDSKAFSVPSDWSLGSPEDEEDHFSLQEAPEEPVLQTIHENSGSLSTLEVSGETRDNTHMTDASSDEFPGSSGGGEASVVSLSARDDVWEGREDTSGPVFTVGVCLPVEAGGHEEDCGAKPRESPLVVEEETEVEITRF